MSSNEVVPVPELTIGRPGTPAYTSSTAVYNLTAVPEPAEALTVRTVDEVVLALSYAAAARTPVHLLTTGHGAARQESMAGHLLVRTQMDELITVDPAARTARVPAGRTWAEVVELASPHGLTALHGSAPTVGVVGYLLHGGLSFYGRKFGVGANSVRAVELVTADGTWHRVDDSHEPELFWALRGGGAGLGIVTAMEIDLYLVGEVYTGAAFWTAEQAGALLRLWRDWTMTAPAGVSTSARLLRLPPGPATPPPLAGRQVLCIDGVAPLQDEAASRALTTLLARLGDIAPPLLDTWHSGSPVEATLSHMDPPTPVPSVASHALLTELPDQAIQALVDQCGPTSGSSLTSAELRHLGGALSDPPKAGGFMDRIEEPWLFCAVSLPLGPGLDDVLAELAVARAAVAPWASAHAVPTFIDDPADQRSPTTPQNDRRRAAVQNEVDPDAVFAGGAYPPVTRTMNSTPSMNVVGVARPRFRPHD